MRDERHDAGRDGWQSDAEHLLRDHQRITADSAYHLGMVAVTKEQWRAMIRVAQERERRLAAAEQRCAALAGALRALVADNNDGWYFNERTAAYECGFCFAAQPEESEADERVNAHRPDCPVALARVLLRDAAPGGEE